jgi:hypothetical protein
MAMPISRTQRGLLALVVAVIAAAALVASAAPAAAAPYRAGLVATEVPQDGEGGGFVWAHNASAPPGRPYIPAPAYQYNSTSPHTAVNTVEHFLGVPGFYRVRFPGIISPDHFGLGVAHVTAYGGGGNYCGINGMGREFDDIHTWIDVACVSPTGAPVDTRFTASVTTVKASWQGRPMAYMKVSPPNFVFQWGFNSSGAANSVTRTGSGAYEVRLPNLGASAGHVQVTAFARSARCKVRLWGPDGTTQVVHVLCFDENGNPVDNIGFFLTYVERLNILGLATGFDPDGHDSAYAWANQQATQDWYTPHTFYQFANFTNDAGTARRTSTGDYVVKFRDVNLDTGNVQVTAYGPGSEYCGVVNWMSFTGIRVTCHNAAGQPVDTRFDVAFTGPFELG